MPGEAFKIFDDGLRRLAATATYLYKDGQRYWYSTQPTVTKLAEDRAEQLRRDPDAVVAELDRRLRADLKRRGDFSRIHPLPTSGADVPDDTDARLVVIGPDHPYSKEAGNRALEAAKAILATRGTAPRMYQNTLVFLAVDQARLQDLDEAVRRFLAWESILGEREELDLSPHQVKQAETQRHGADSAVSARIPEAYQWLLVPEQATPKDEIAWQPIRLSGQDALAARASRKLLNDELLITQLAGSRLRLELDRVPLWREEGKHVPVRQLVEDFARYLYLPRLADSAVLRRAIEDGLGLLTWESDSFAYADDWDEREDRYRGLKAGEHATVSDGASGLVVEPKTASAQLAAVKPTPVGPGPGPEPGPGPGPEPPSPEKKLTRFHGSVELGPTRLGRDAGQIAEEVIAHLAGLQGADVQLTLEIEARVPEGVPENVVRTVTENARTLKFSTQGFEEE
jgi:hypothetical protein